MTFISVPWDGEENDMYESQWRAYHEAFGDGLISVGSAGQGESDRTFSISGLRGLLQGAYFEQNGTDSIEVPPPSSGQRVSQVSLEYRPEANTVGLAVKHGGPGSVPPVPTQEDNGVWQMPLFEYGPAGQGALDTLPRSDLRPRMPRLMHAPTERRREILAYTARYADIAFDDDGTWWRFDRTKWKPWWPTGETNGWIAAPANGIMGYTGSFYYARRGGVAYARGRVVRASSTGINSILGNVPNPARPQHEVDTVAWQNLTAGRRFHAMTIGTDGQITVHPGQGGDVVGGVAVRFHAAWPLF